MSQKKLRDAGPQLSKVLEFKQREALSGEVLFQRFRDAADWKSQLSWWLLQYLLDLTSSDAPETESEQGILTPTIPANNIAAAQLSDSTNHRDKVSLQLKDLIGILNKVVENGQLEFSIQDDNLLHEFEVARLHLLSSTWLYGRYTGELLESHEINKLYKYRERLEMASDERLQIFRALIGDSSDIRPGWFWFQETSPHSVEDGLLNLIVRDSSEDVKLGSLRILKAAQINISNDLWPILPIFDESLMLRNAAYEYLSSLADSNLLTFLDDLIEQEKSDIAEDARDAKIRILLSSNPTQTFDELLKSSPYIPDSLIDLISKVASQITDESLLTGTTNDSGQLREFSVRELARRRSLPRDLARTLTEDPSIEIREIAFRDLASRGEELDFAKLRKSLTVEGPSGYLHFFSSTTKRTPDADAVILSYYGSQSTEKLLELVDWFSIEGINAYKVLSSERFHAIEGEIRSDLRDGFVRIKERSVEAIKSRLGTDAAERAIRQFDELDSFIHSQFIQAALRGLEMNGQSSDISFGRHYLDSSEYLIKTLSVSIVSKFGNHEDSPALLKIMREGLGEIQEKAAAGALHLSPQPFQVAYELIENSNASLKKIGFEWLLDQDSTQVWDLFDKLLGNETTTTRVRSVYFFWSKLDRQKLQEKLVEYLNRTTYYYNVVTWLDRLLYSPVPLREMFVEHLQKEAKCY